MHRILLHLILHTNFTNFHFKKLSTLWMENFVTEVRCKKKKLFSTKLVSLKLMIYLLQWRTFLTFLMSTNSHIIWISFCTSCKEMWKIVLQICGSNKKCRTFFSTFKKRDRPIFAEIVVTKGLVNFRWKFKSFFKKDSVWHISIDVLPHSVEI